MPNSLSEWSRPRLRELKPDDYEALRSFFRGLTDETIALMSYFDSRGFKTNTEEGSIMAARRLTSEIIVKGYPPEQFVLVAEEDAVRENHFEIVGLAWLDFPWKPVERYTCFLGIIVSHIYQGKGIGTALMKGLIAEAWKRKMRKISLNCYSHNERAIHLYEKFEFKMDGWFTQQEWTEDNKPLDVMSMSRFL